MKKNNFEILDKRLELAEKALLLRYNLLKDVVSDVSPIHWQHGAIARLKKRRKNRSFSLLVVMQRFLLAISVFMKQLD